MAENKKRYVVQRRRHYIETMVIEAESLYHARLSCGVPEYSHWRLNTVPVIIHVEPVKSCEGDYEVVAVDLPTPLEDKDG